MENHELAIGIMKTACSVAAYPQAVAPLRTRLERSVVGPFPAQLAKAAEPVLHGRNGVVRIRNLKLDLAHHGEWDERTLAALIASRLAATLANLIDTASDSVRSWPDHNAYMASFIEHKLGLAQEPDWAFPEFVPLRLLSPEQAAAEMLKSRPNVFAVLAANGSRVGNACRVAARLGAVTAADIVNAWMGLPGVAAEPFATDFADPGLPIPLQVLAGTRSADIYQQILMLVSELVIRQDKRDMLRLIKTAVIMAAITKLQADKPFMALHGLTPLAAVTEQAAAELPLPNAIARFLKQAVAENDAPEILDRLFDQVSGDVISGPAKKHAGKRRAQAGKATLQTIHSPFAGIILLLPDIIRLGMRRHLSRNALRDSVLAIADPEMQPRFGQDELFQTIFPEEEIGTESPVPPVPDALIAVLAPESRQLVTGREGADGWADLLLASFASRLPGLRASSRGYLIRQFLAVPGKADITGEAIVVTLDGPPLAIVLKMAGLSGDQLPIPFFGNRLLFIKLGGSR